LLTFFLSVENSRRRFTTESESDHCERKTEFVFIWQCQLGLFRRHCNVKSTVPTKSLETRGGFSAFNTASYGLTCPQYFCYNSR
jgi:hypothetical protein